MARREVVERVRERAFAVSTALLVAIVAGSVLVIGRGEGAESPGASAPAQADAGAAYALFGVLLLYGALLAYGNWVAAGVIEEKASRVVEVLLAAIRPSELLAGKVIGVGVVALCQLAIVYGSGLAAALWVTPGGLPRGALSALGLLLFWFALGYALYAWVFAVAGALVARPEQLQVTLTPLSVAVVSSAFVALAALENPDAPLVRAASLFPPLAPMVMPIRAAAGSAPAWEQVLAAALMVAGTAALVPLCARVYSGAILRTGRRVSLREAWRALGRR